MIIKPCDIEKRSFEIIASNLGEKFTDWETAPVLMRVIHATADFDYAENLKFSPGVVPYAADLLKNGSSIATDTNMAKAGINKETFEKGGGSLYCFMADKDVAQKAKAQNVTRASAAVEKAASIKEPLIFAVGNAPTALMKIYDLVKSGELKPALIIGVPVGFVNVSESKELIMELDVPYIVSRGRKGGSNVAAAIVNALLYIAFPREA